VEKIENNARRYMTLFYKAADELMKKAEPSVDATISTDVVDVLIQQRLAKSGENSAADGIDVSTNFPPALTRRYELTFKTLNKDKALAVRDIKSKDVGHLVKVTVCALSPMSSLYVYFFVSCQGIITRVTEVKPMVVVATYSCDQCGYETYQEILSKSFSPLLACNSKTCKENGSAGRLFLQTRGSKFVKFQEIKLQELVSYFFFFLKRVFMNEITYSPTKYPLATSPARSLSASWASSRALPTLATSLPSRAYVSVSTTTSRPKLFYFLG